MMKPDDIQYTAARLWAFIAYASRKFLSDHCFSFAQALTYTTIFSIIPILAIVFSIFHSLGGLESLHDVIFGYLSEMLTPGGQHLVQETLRELLEKAQSAPIGSFSIVFFIVIAFLLLMELEDVLNYIWSASGHRPFLRRIALYWLAFTLGPVIMVIPLLMTLFLSSQAEAFKSVLLFIDPFMQFLRLLPVLSIWFFLWATYMFLPNTYIKPEAAAVGTLVGGSLWLLAAKIYTIYNTYVLTYSKLYGSLGAIPIFLLWLFISWCIILYGAEVAYCYQYWRGIQRRQGGTVFEEVNSANILALHLVLSVYWRFQSGLPGLSLVELCAELGASPRDVRPVLNALERHEILTLEAKKHRILPLQPAHLLTVYEIWSAIGHTAAQQTDTALMPEPGPFHSIQGPWEPAISALLLQGNACFLEKTGKITVSDLLSQAHAGPATPVDLVK
jgi:membrane protein